MTKISIAWVVALSLAAVGCKKSGADCDKAIANSMELSKASMAKMPGVDDKMLGKLRDVGVKSCKDDKWSADVTKCMADAKAEAEAQACYGKLTGEQQAKMNKAAMELMTPPSGSAAAGSAAAGSAAAGSAAAGSAASGSAAAGSDPGAAAAAGSGTAPAGGSDPAAGSAAAPK